jgi:hypothetical protein
LNGSMLCDHHLLNCPLDSIPVNQLSYEYGERNDDDDASVVVAWSEMVVMILLLMKALLLLILMLNKKMMMMTQTNDETRLIPLSLFEMTSSHHVCFFAFCC